MTRLTMNYLQTALLLFASLTAAQFTTSPSFITSASMTAFHSSSYSPSVILVGDGTSSFYLTLSSMASATALATSSPAATTSDSDNLEDPGLSAGATVGVVLATLFWIIVISLCCCCCCRYRARQEAQQSIPAQPPAGGYGRVTQMETREPLGPAMEVVAPPKYEAVQGATRPPDYSGGPYNANDVQVSENGGHDSLAEAEARSVLGSHRSDGATDGIGECTDAHELDGEPRGRDLEGGFVPR